MTDGDNKQITLITIAMPILAISAAAAFFYFVAPILVPMTIAAATAYTMVPVVAFLKRFKIPHFLAVFMVMASLLGIGIIIVIVLISEISNFIGALPQYQQDAINLFGQTKEYLNANYSGIFNLFPQIKDINLNPSYFSSIGKIFFKGIGSVTSLAFQGFLLFFLTYFMLSDYEMFSEKFRMLFGADKKATVSNMLEQIDKQLRGFIVVKVLVTIGLAIVLTIGLLIMRVPYAYIWGPFAAILNLIPYVGPIIGAIPPVIVAGITNGSFGAMIPPAIFFLVVQILESNLITPKLTSNSVDLNPLAVLVSSIIWGYLWGAVGIILAVPITAAIKVVCDNIERLEPIGILLGGRGK